MGRKAKYAVIVSANAPPRGHTSPFGVLKTLDNLELKIGNLRLKLAYSLLEAVP